MVRMKLTKEEFDPKKLDVEVEGRRFERYDGEIPRNGTILQIRVTKMWWTQADDGTSMIKLIAVAEDNNGRLAQFNGLPTWEYLTWKSTAAFRYKPFLQCFDIPLSDIGKDMDVEQDDDNIGTPINSIGDWVVGSDDAVARIVIKRDRYNGEWTSKVDVDGWLPLEDDVEPEDEEEEEEDTRPPRRGRSTQAPARGAKAASGRSRDVPEDDDEDEEDEEYDEDVEDEEEDEEEEEEAPPRRGSRARAASSSRARPARTRAATGPSTSRRASADGGSRRSSSGSSRSTTRGGGTKRGKDDPPF
jgi:hypothetical protein